MHYFYWLILAAFLGWPVIVPLSAADQAIAASQAIKPTGGATQPLLSWVISPPLGLPPMHIPQNNPMTEKKIALGRKLFFDRRLSFNRTLSCAMCHIPEQGFTQHEIKTPVGIEGRFVKRNAPALYNVGYRQLLFHDGREHSLENQIWQPLLRVNEMANPSIGFVLDTIRAAEDYRGLFEAAFGRGPGMETVGMALASYQRGLVSANSAFDRWYFGEEEHAMGAAALRGFKLFQAEGCIRCHSISENHALFSDGQFHNTGIGFASAMLSERNKAATLRLAPGVEVTTKVHFDQPQSSDLGRYEATGRAEDRWLFRTPSLRNVAVTAPYMHDGSLPDLASVLDFYNRGAVPHSELDSRLRAMGLDREQLEDLRSFLLALTGDNLLQLQTDGRSTTIGDTLNTQ